jgi:hypothetical protein
MIYDFMLAIASNGQLFSADIIYELAAEMADKYLEKLS